MNKTITVKGIGRATAKPDTVVLSMLLESRAMEYDKAMEIAAENIADITEVLVGSGFEKDAVKTMDFNVRTEYERIEDHNRNYYREFKGYLISHKLKVEFDLNVKRLSIVLSAIAGCHAYPKISISFTVKDAAAIREEMLRFAAANARKKAEILCDASGVALGSLVCIDYNWGELNVRSSTTYNSLAEREIKAPVYLKHIDIEPDNIDVSDTVTFVWEIN